MSRCSQARKARGSSVGICTLLCPLKVYVISPHILLIFQLVIVFKGNSLSLILAVYEKVLVRPGWRESCKFTVTNVLREYTTQTAVRGLLKHTLLFHMVGNSEYLRTNHIVHISSIAPSSRWCLESLLTLVRPHGGKGRASCLGSPGKLGGGEYSPARGDTRAPPGRLLTHTGWLPQPPAGDVRGPTAWGPDGWPGARSGFLI